MKYILKKVSVILCVAMMLVTFLPINHVQAESFPNTITGITKDEVLNYSGPSLYYKKYANGVLFCSTFHIPDVGTSCALSSSQWSVATQAGVAAIVNKYNNAPSKQAYYNAELAINEFIYYYETGNPINKIKSDSEVRKISGVKDFYDVAVSAYNDAKKNFEISVTTESGKLDFTLDNEYYVSNKITVSGAAEYEVAMTGAEGLEIYNQKDDSFYVRFPSSNVENNSQVVIKVTVNGVKNLQVAKKYDCGGDNQELVPNLVDKIKMNDDASISGSITKNSVTKLKISKQDITTKQELKGATLSIYNSSDELIDTWETGDTPYYKEGLPVGDYYIVETKAPAGYTLSDEKISFSLIDDGNVKEVVVYNKHNDKHKVKISKQDITTKKELPGATLIIKDSQGNEIARWVTSDKPYELELEKGEYTLTEIQAPNGYDLSYEVIKFTVGEKNEVETTVVMYNSKTPDTGDINILLIISFMIMATAGVGFSIYKLKTQK